MEERHIGMQALRVLVRRGHHHHGGLPIREAPRQRRDHEPLGGTEEADQRRRLRSLLHGDEERRYQGGPISGDRGSRHQGRDLMRRTRLVVDTSGTRGMVTTCPPRAWTISRPTIWSSGQSPPLTSTSGCTAAIRLPGSGSSKITTWSTQANAASTSARWACGTRGRIASRDRKSTRLNSSHPSISYAVFCLKKKKAKHKAFLDR